MDTNPTATCGTCGKTFKNAHGLNIHRGRVKCDPPALPEDERRENAAVGPEHPDLLKRLTDLRQSTPILPNIPRGARNSVAEELSKTLNACLRDLDNNWDGLFTFSCRVLRAPLKHDRKKSLASIVKENLSQPVPDAIAPKKERRTIMSQQMVRKIVDKKLSAGDISGAVRILASDDAVVEPTEEVILQLKEKHPAAAADMTFPPEPEVRTVPPVTAKEVLDAVRSFPNGSAGGVDGLSPQHLKNLHLGTQDEFKRKLHDSLLQFCDHVLAGNVPEPHRSLFFGQI